MLSSEIGDQLTVNWAKMQRRDAAAASAYLHGADMRYCHSATSGICRVLAKRSNRPPATATSESRRRPHSPHTWSWKETESPRHTEPLQHVLDARRLFSLRRNWYDCLLTMRRSLFASLRGSWQNRDGKVLAQNDSHSMAGMVFLTIFVWK